MDSDILSNIIAFWQMCMNIAAPIATVAVAIIGLKCLLGSEKDMEHGMDQIRVILIAIVCLEMVPLVYSLVINSISSYEGRGLKPWSPENVSAPD